MVVNLPGRNQNKYKEVRVFHLSVRIDTMKIACLFTVLVITVVDGFIQRNPTFCSSALKKPSGSLPSIQWSKDSSSLQQQQQPSVPVLRRECRQPPRLAALTKDTLNDNTATTDRYWDSIRIGAVVAYISLLTFVFLAPGQFADPADNAMFDKILADPVNPGINAIYYTLFNLFAVMPIILAAVSCPQAPKQGVPPAPFLLGSVAFGFFTFGPYLIFRKQPLEQVSTSDLDWITRNIFENRIFGVFTVVFTILVLLAPDALGAYQGKFTQVDPIKQILKLTRM